jgi:hypothetical protein
MTDQQIMKELCQIENGLSEWEVGFVDDVTKQVEAGGSLSKDQRKKAEQILEEKGPW